MKIIIKERFETTPSNIDEPTIILTIDNWNDYDFYTLYSAQYKDSNTNTYDLGAVRIGFIGQTEGRFFLKNKSNFNSLGEEYFSLGVAVEYYQKLNSLEECTRNEILNSLNDIAKNDNILDKVMDEAVFNTSFLRFISITTIRTQFRRVAKGGVILTNYNFNYTAPTDKGTSILELTFEIIPESHPPTNIHVLIGRNGVGKTYLTHNMIGALLNNNPEEYGTFDFHNNSENEFANLISVSFSAFDETRIYSNEEYKDSLKYWYIGLKKINSAETKNSNDITKEFCESFNYCRSAHKDKLKKIINELESDPYFKQSEIKDLIEIDNNEKIMKTFCRLSSGHKIILLTITQILEKLAEKSLVIIDEPEAHLHPPLLSAFIRALSNLLISTNGVAIVVTHSPVILQEVPKSCVWKLRRHGKEAIAERLSAETFGENVGILTNEVFGLEVTNSGFYTLLNEVADKYDSYENAVNHFEGQLGMEAKAILMTKFQPQ